MRDYLPGIEPERRLTDWGRSERVEGLLDRTLVEFLYRHWFRAEVEGIDHVPDAGGALLVSNRAGAVAPDAAMIAKAVREEARWPRALHVAVAPAWQAYPGLAMLVAKLGGVAAHPANVHRLLHDEEQLVLSFPEGGEAATKLFRDRYRLRPFGVGFVEAAMRAHAPIVPVAVLGAEEAAPVFGRLNPLGRLTRLPALPITPTFPHGGLLGALGYLPAKFRIRFLAPVPTDQWGPEPWEDRDLIWRVAGEVRGLVQEQLTEMLDTRKSVWFG
jgi:1-acyl-sn-glycerol-3-phosphate acyltransferase